MKYRKHKLLTYRHTPSDRSTGVYHRNNAADLVGTIYRDDPGNLGDIYRLQHDTTDMGHDHGSEKVVAKCKCDVQERLHCSKCEREG